MALGEEISFVKGFYFPTYYEDLIMMTQTPPGGKGQPLITTREAA